MRLLLGSLVLLALVGCKGEPCPSVEPPPVWKLLTDEIVLPGAHVCADEKKFLRLQITGERDETIAALVRHMESKGWTKTAEKENAHQGVFLAFEKGPRGLNVDVDRAHGERGVTQLRFNFP